MVACKHETSAQRLTLVYGLGTAAESFEHDVYLRKGKADVLWRFARPPRQLEDDWDAVLMRDPGFAGFVGGGRAPGRPAASAAAGGGAGAGGAGGGKKRKAVAAAPYTKEAVQQAVNASLASHRVDDLKAMLQSIEERRKSVVGQLALERVREMLKGMSASPRHVQAVQRLA